MTADILARLPDLLRSLAAADQVTAGLQLIPPEQPFEPNPTVPTLVYGLAAAEHWRDLLTTLKLSVATAQPVWLLRADRAPEQATLGTLGETPPEVEALYIPAIAPEAAERSLYGLRQIVHRLRAPGGCPWDREQTHESLVRYVLEEAYEVADAIRDGSGDLAEELGDLLLQVFLQAELAEEAGRFNLNDVVEHICTKLIRRHPHVFGDVMVANAAEVERNWERLKGAEKSERTSVLDGIPRSLPALRAAQELQKRLKRAGFDWPDSVGVEQKLDEELAELRQADSPVAAAAELGDVLFILTRLGLDLGADAEEALRGTNRRASARFRHVEQRVRESRRQIRDVPLEELLALWDGAKALERSESATTP